jgi:cell fate (sporulation/competence/biofilm development) regulator YlbF (YheA/YmcA/DUF963 family)
MHWLTLCKLKLIPGTQQIFIKMGKEYLRYNPVARSLSSSYFTLNENQNVEDLIKRIADALASNCKKICFDIASDKNRNPDQFRKKVEQLSGSSSAKNLLAKVKDICNDVEVIDPHFAEIKNLYINSLSSIGEAVKRAIEIDPSKEAKFIDLFEKSLGKMQIEMDKIAKEKAINEGLIIGYDGRVDRLRKILISLICDSKGKDSKNGYGRDWQRIFSQLKQRLDSLSSSGQRKDLTEIEKKVDNLCKEYNEYKVKSAEQVMAKIQKDDDLYQKFSDVNDLFTNALDDVTKAFTQEGIIEIKIREEMEEKESSMNDRVFPLKMGDKDTDPRLRGSGIIEAVQRALIDAYSPLKNILDPRGGADGKFEEGTSVAVKAIQGAMDNKNINGEVDKALLDSLLKLDQVSSQNKDLIKSCLDSLRNSYANLSESSVMSISSFMGLWEDKRYIDPDRISDELKKYQEELETVHNDGNPTTSDFMLAERLAKLLRTKGYNKNAEAENFLREDNTLKGSCPADFISSWTEAVDGDKEVSHFAMVGDDGNIAVYPTKRLSTNVNKPCNWNSYSKFHGSDSEDVDSFGDWYTGYYKNFSGIDSDTKGKAVEDVFRKNADCAGQNLKEMESAYRSCSESLKSCNDSISRGYLPHSALKEMKRSIEGVCGDKIDLDNMNPAEQRFVYNCAVFLSPLISYDDKKESWKCALDMALEKYDMDAEGLAKNIVKNNSFRSKSPMMKESMCSLVPVKESDTNAHCLECMEIDGDVSDDNFLSVKNTLKKIPPVLRSKAKHLDRISIIGLDTIPTHMKESIYIIPGSA